MIQIFGTRKSSDCRAAERFFKERRVPFQFIDLGERGMSAGEFESVVSAMARTAGSRAAAVDALTDKRSRGYASVAYLDDGGKEEKLFGNQRELLKLPVCRNGRAEATAGRAESVWKGWA